MKTAKDILHDKNTWNTIFAKYPFDEYEGKMILRAMEEYAKQERAEAWDEGFEVGIRESAPSDEAIDEIKTESYEKGYNDNKLNNYVE